MKKKFNFLIYIVLIPLSSTLFFLLVSISAYTYFNIKDGKSMVCSIKKSLIQDKKDIVKDRVGFVMSCIKSKQTELKEKIKNGSYSKNDIKKLTEKTKNDIKNTINDFYFAHHGYVFIYKILSFNGGKNFAVMIANPNRKDLIGKYISDDYKDAKGFMFRKEFLKKIRKKGKGFVEYYYKKPNSKKISPKISYFELDKEWNWVVASGVYLDDIYINLQHNQERIMDKIRKNNIVISVVALFILALSLFFSIVILNIIKRKFTKYEEYIGRQRRALFVSSRMLKKQLYRDHLTKLKNRIMLLQNIEKQKFSVLMIVDIDDFKIINELYGYEMGNNLLVELSEILIDFAKQYQLYATVYRLGSDEFVLLINKKLDVKKCQDMAKTLYNHIISCKFKLFRDIAINMSVTMGISMQKKDALPKADIALNFAKQNRKNFIIYRKEIDNRLDIKENIKIKQKLIKAIKEDNVVPFFQPISNQEGKIVKYESLIRIIDNEEQRILFPDEFLKIAKKLKIYPELSKIMFKKSFERFKESDKFFSLNISLNDIVNIETVNFIENIISKNKETSKRLILEILESEGIEDFELTKKFIQKVRKMGAKIAIDDFGSGYSSFKYILEIKPDFIKIDGSLISDIEHNKENLFMVKNIVNMAKDLHITTVAEFVSSKAIFEILQQLGVDEYQGYYIGKPSQKLIS